MAVEKLDNGTFRVGVRTFSTAEEAFAYDGLKSVPEGGAATGPAEGGRKSHRGSQWSRMSTSSRVGAVAALAVLAAFLWGAAKVWLSGPPASPTTAAEAEQRHSRPFWQRQPWQPSNGAKPP